MTSSSSTLELKFTNKATEIFVAINQTPNFQTIIFKTSGNFSNAIDLLTNNAFKTKFQDSPNARAIIFEVDNLSDANIWKIIASNFSPDREVVIGFLNKPLASFNVFWKLKSTSFVWAHFGDKINLGGCDIEKVLRFIVGMLAESVKNGLSGSS
jgi:hypothetical protein